MKLINVRLDDADVRKVGHLRKQGVEISALVREAIRAEYERRRRQKRKGRKMSDVIDEIVARHPTPPGTPPRGYNVHNRHEARAAILDKLRGAKRRSA